MSTRKRFHAPLYFLLNLPSARPALELAQEAIAGGVDAIQLRAKEASAATLYETAQALRTMTRSAEVALIINDRLDVALAVDADGVHLGKEDLPLEAARALAPSLWIGVSCYGSVRRAEEAIAQGADYVAFGAFFNSPSKPQAPTIPLSTLREAQDLSVPVVAIGGITEATIPSLISAGAESVAVISAIQDAASPKNAAARCKQALLLPS